MLKYCFISWCLAHICEEQWLIFQMKMYILENKMLNCWAGPVWALPQCLKLQRQIEHSLMRGRQQKTVIATSVTKVLILVDLNRERKKEKDKLGTGKGCINNQDKNIWHQNSASCQKVRPIKYLMQVLGQERRGQVTWPSKANHLGFNSSWS